jgi:hypothetical protein
MGAPVPPSEAPPSAHRRCGSRCLSTPNLNTHRRDFGAMRKRPRARPIASACAYLLVCACPSICQTNPSICFKWSEGGSWPDQIPFANKTTQMCDTGAAFCVSWGAGLRQEATTGLCSAQNCKELQASLSGSRPSEVPDASGFVCLECQTTNCNKVRQAPGKKASEGQVCLFDADCLTNDCAVQLCAGSKCPYGACVESIPIAKILFLLVSMMLLVVAPMVWKCYQGRKIYRGTANLSEDQGIEMSTFSIDESPSGGYTPPVLLGESERWTSSTR